MDEHARDAGTAARRRDIQGLRAIAVLLVVAYHAGLPVPGGFIGVDVFFVISGYVITSMLQREWRSTGRIRFGTFYWRRFKRLTPALALVISVTALFSVVLVSPFGVQQSTSKTALGAMTLSANFVINLVTGGYFDAPASANPLLNTWSLSVEEQFYLVFPALITAGWWIAARHRRLRSAAFWIIAASGLVSLTATMLSAGGAFGNDYRFVLGFYSPVLRAWEFVLGALLVLAQRRPGVLGVRAYDRMGVVGLAALLISPALISDAATFPGPWTLLPTLATALLLEAGSRSTAWPTRLLARRPMVALGDWSYSIYLWHWPCIALARSAFPDMAAAPLLAAAFSFVPAIASYRFVEQPIRQLTPMRTPAMLRLVSATVVPTLVLSLGLGFGAQSGWFWPRLTALQAELQTEHLSVASGCHTLTPIADRPGTCVFNADASGAPMYLIGDSHGDHLSDGVVAAAELLQRPLTIATANTCPFADVWGGGPLSVCRAWYTATLAWLVQQPAGTVVIANSGLALTNDGSQIGASPSTITDDPDAKLRAASAGLGLALAALRGAGHRVVLVEPVPRFTADVVFEPSSCNLIDVWRDACHAEQPLQMALAQQHGFRAALQANARRYGTGLLDPYPWFCDEQVCRTRVHGVDAYRDASHISVPASRMLAPMLAAAVRAADHQVAGAGLP